MDNIGRATKTYAFEDFTPGRQFELGPYRVLAEEIVAFNREIDGVRPPGTGIPARHRRGQF
jgi:hypothetical protein